MIKDQHHSAYPVPMQEEGPLYPGYGLSKKELFAAMAMQGLLSKGLLSNPNEHLTCSQIIECSITLATELCNKLPHD